VKIGMNDGLKKFQEGTGKKLETLNVGPARGFDESRNFGANGFYFDTSSVFNWFMKKRGGEKEPEIMRLLIAQRKFASYLVKEEIYKSFGNHFEDNFENIWKEFMNSMNFSPLEKEKFDKSRNINDEEYDKEHDRLCKEMGLFMITQNIKDFESLGTQCMNIEGLLKKIQDLS